MTFLSIYQVIAFFAGNAKENSSDESFRGSLGYTPHFILTMNQA
jgi:hypothetical protein